MDSLRETSRLRKQVSDNEALWQDQVRKNQRLLRQLRDAHEDIRALRLRVEFLEERQEGRDSPNPSNPQPSPPSHETMKEALGLAVALLDKERTQRDVLATRIFALLEPEAEEQEDARLHVLLARLEDEVSTDHRDTNDHDRHDGGAETGTGTKPSGEVVEAVVAAVEVQEGAREGPGEEERQQAESLPVAPVSPWRRNPKRASRSSFCLPPAKK